jgi:hypothetical protein
LIKTRSVLYNLCVPFAGWQEEVWWEEERDGGKGIVEPEGKFWLM